jgi:hypothetical protein
VAGPAGGRAEVDDLAAGGLLKRAGGQGEAVAVQMVHAHLPRSQPRAQAGMGRRSMGLPWVEPPLLPSTHFTPNAKIAGRDGASASASLKQRVANEGAP